MNENKKTPPALKALFGDQIEFRESSLYDSESIKGESPVAKAVNEANKLPDSERLEALSKLAKKIIGEA